MTRHQRLVLLSRWVNGRVDPAAVYVEMERLRRKHRLTGEDLLEVARPESSPIHGAFEWDDSVAGEEYRLIQARNLCRAIAVKVDDLPPRRVYVHVPSPTGRGGGTYERPEIVVQHVDMFAAALEEALDDLRAAQQRVVDLRRFTEGREDRVAVLAVAVAAMHTAREAVQSLVQ